MSCDKLVFDLSQEVEGSPSVFVRKDWLNILDNQNSNYNSNQSVIDTSQLSNSNKYMSYREAYIACPLLLTLSTASDATANTTDGFTPATAAQSADYAIGLKNWFGQIVHSMTLDYNGTTIIQQTPFCNMWNSFKLMTSFSWNDVATQGDTIGFYPDDPLTLSVESNAAGQIKGLGACNNSNGSVSGLAPGNPVVLGAFANRCVGSGNSGYIKRQLAINYDPAGVISAGVGALTNANLLTANSATNLWKSYIFNKANGTTAGGANVLPGVIQWNIVATIYLKHLHAFFASVPLLKGAYMKLTLNLNNTSVSYSMANLAANPVSYDATFTVSNAIGGVNPIMLSSAEARNGANACYPENAASTAAAANVSTKMTANLSVGATCLNNALANNGVVQQGTLARSIYLYVPSYTFNPVFEQAYLSSPVKQIKYTDIYQYQISNIAASTGLVNQLITNGIANIKSILILPFYSSQAGSANTGIPTGIPVYQSPYDPAGTGATSPLTLISNFNVVVSGQNAIYNTEKYAFEQFNNQLYGVNAVNGGMTDGLTSGLVNRLGFDTQYTYYYVDLSRMLPVEEAVPKSIQIIGQNMSARAVDYWVFVEYGVEISIDALTGVRV